MRDRGEPASGRAPDGAPAESACIQRMIGTCYQFGARGLRPDWERAAYWYGAAAERGDALAQELLGMLYLLGLGVQQDAQLAAQWIRLSAEQDNPGAQAMLANAYEYGWGGLPVDKIEAARWDRLAQRPRESGKTP